MVCTDKVPYRDATGKIIGVIVFAVDISHEKYAEQRISELADELKRAVVLRDEFMSIASHELETPLSSLSLQLEYLAKFSLSPEKFSSLLTKAKTQVHRITDLINVMLDVSRISSGRLALEAEEMDLRQMVYDVIQQFAEQLQEMGCLVEVNAPDAVVGCWEKF